MAMKQPKTQAQPLRRIGSLSFRVKLVTAFLAMIITTVAILAYFNNQLARSNLTQAANANLLSGASQTTARLDDFISTNLSLIRTQAQLPIFARYLDLVATQQVSFELETEIRTIFQTFAGRHSIQASSHALLNRQGINVVDNRGINIGQDESAQPYFQEVMRRGFPYVSSVKFSPNNSLRVINFSAPVRSLTSGEIVGVLRLSIEANVLQHVVDLNTELVGLQSFAVLLDENHIRLAHGKQLDLVMKSVMPLGSERVAELQAARRLPDLPLGDLSTNLPEFEAGLNNVDEQPFFEAYLEGGGWVNAAVTRMESRPWLVIFAQPQAVYIAPINAQTQTILLLATVLTLVMTLISLGVARWLTGPITHFIEVVNRVREGDLTAQANIEANDEIGVLANTFNSMVQRIRRILHNLEDRSQQLETIAALSERFNALLNLDQLLPEMVNQIQDKLGYYHAHIYLLDESSNTLTVVEGTGKAGAEMKRQGHSIDLNAPTSLAAQAARDNEIVRMDNVRSSPTWMPNQLLPDTQSEIAVPIMLESQVVGVLDVQSDKVAGLDEGDESLLRSLANQAAIAIKNARLLTERQMTIQRLKEVDEAKSRFITMISHELRTPLNAINGFAELLLFDLSGDISAEAKHDVQLIHNNGKHLSSLINNIIDITQIEKEETSITVESINVAETVEEVVAETRSLVMDKPVELVSEIDPELPNIRADPTRLKQILLNLLSNAIKFTPEGEARVVVNRPEQSDYIKFAVLDTGIGIDSEELETIFELFQQADMSDARQYGGLGVGLSTSKQLVGLHGGEIGVQSEEGVGSTFWFTMPIEKVDL